MVSAINFCIAYVVVDALCLVLNFIISTNVSRDSGSETQVRYFFLLLTANLIFVIFDATWAILVFSQVFDPPEVLLSIVNGINLTAIAFAAYFWFCFSLAFFESQVTNSKRLRLLTALPAMSVILIHVIGYFTNQNVIFMPDGTVQYGIAHTIITVVPLAYLLAATVIALRRYRHAESANVRRMSLVFITFMIAPGAAGILDLLIPDMPFAAASIMISISFVMMALQESRISSDALTGLNNRRRAELFLEDSVSHASSANPIYLFIIDMNHFKSINDTYGHLEGDHALKLMADTLRSVSSQVNAFTARWGGDEFVIISAKGGLHDPELIVALVKETLEKLAKESDVEYELSCSVGFAKCDSPSKGRANLVAEADKMLYLNKQDA